MSLAGRKIILRADASHARGIGHVMRCMALGDQLQAAGAQLCFAAASLPEATERQIIARGHQVLRLPGGAESDLAALKNINAHWLVVDSYDIDAADRARLAQAAPRMAIIDDVCDNGPYDADLLINPNPGAHLADYQPALQGARHAIGAAYVLLRPEIIAAKTARSFHAKGNVFISCGGSDPTNAAQRCLDYLSAFDAARLEIEVLLGPAAKTPGIENAAKQNPHKVRLLGATQSIEKQLNWADVALLAAGTTQWEAAYLGCPFIALAVADNQLPGAQHFARQCGSSLLDWRSTQDSISFIAAFSDLYGNAALCEHRAATGQRLIDGQGAQRAAALFV